MPFWKLSTVVRDFSSSNMELLRSKQNIVKENQKLLEEISLKEKDLIFISVLKKENEELKKIEKGANYRDMIITSVISRPPKTPYDILIIDSGKLSNIDVGNKVLIDGDVFVGEVYEVSDYTSKVKLYSSPEEKTDVLIGENKIQKEAIGMGAGNFKIEIPKEIEVKIGDAIEVPSITANIFGVVEKIEEKSADSFKVVLFKSPVNIQEIKFVEVWNKK